MDKLNDASKQKYNNLFMEITPEQRKDLLIATDKDAKEYQKKVSDYNSKEDAKQVADSNYKKQKMCPHYFTMMKQITLLGFFTSKPGATQALRYIAVPGKFDGNYPYKKGDRAWA